MITPIDLRRASQTDVGVVSTDSLTVARLVDELLDRANLSLPQASRLMGISPETLKQYRYGQRENPSVKWLSRLVEICGGKLLVEFPNKPLRS